MKFTETKLKGAFIIELEPFIDLRGSFARTFCANEFTKHGLRSNLVQSNLSISKASFFPLSLQLYHSIEVVHSSP